MDDFIAVVKSLSDAHRIRSLLALEGKELCACQIIELLNLAPSTVSKHMSILKQAGLVKSRKVGRWIYYCQASDHVSTGAKEAMKWVDSALKNDKTIKKDRILLKNIIKKHPRELCKK